MPEHLTVIRVIPERNEMVEDEEVERIGMEVAMEYKRQQGRVPEDITKENLSFDIRSRIEVKARAGEGAVALTPSGLRQKDSRSSIGFMWWQMRQRIQRYTL